MLKKIKKFAPVLIITLNRDEHFINCVNSLSACMHADKTDLYIALDYPSKENHWEGYNKILEYLPKITGFNSVNIIRREHNYGIEKNYFDAVDFVFEKYDRLIFSEDDNLFSDDFLNFMSCSLDVYKDRADVFSVSGYNYPIDTTLIDWDIYLWAGHSAWGVGFWKEKWYKINWDKKIVLSQVESFLKNYLSVVRFNRIANHYLPAMITMLEMQRENGDGYICLYQYIHKLYSVFPKYSRVKNLGHDGSGNHCVEIEDDIYQKQMLYSGGHEYEIPIDLKQSISVNKLLYNHFKRSKIENIKTFLKVLLINWGIRKFN